MFNQTRNAMVAETKALMYYTYLYNKDVIADARDYAALAYLVDEALLDGAREAAREAVDKAKEYNALTYLFEHEVMDEVKDAAEAAKKLWN